MTVAPAYIRPHKYYKKPFKPISSLGTARVHSISTSPSSLYHLLLCKEILVLNVEQFAGKLILCSLNFFHTEHNQNAKPQNTKITKEEHFYLLFNFREQIKQTSAAF